MDFKNCRIRYTLFTLISLVLMACSGGSDEQVLLKNGVYDDFEGDGNITSWYGDQSLVDKTFSNPFSMGINTSATVLKYQDTGGKYANVRFDAGGNFDLSSDAVFSLKIYVPSEGISGNQPNQISLKLQDGFLSEPWVTQSEIIKPIVLDQWQTVTFDFANDSFLNFDDDSLDPIARKDFNRIVLQVNSENNNDVVEAYMDDFLYNGKLLDSDMIKREYIGVLPFDELVWSDEFNISGLPDSKKWNYDIGNSGWGNNEKQYYTNRPENAEVRDSVLVITLKKENYGSALYTSARLKTKGKFTFTYGRVEVRAKLPTGRGTWPAIWTLGDNISSVGWPDCGEIDIMEHVGFDQDHIHSAVHNRASYGATISKGGQRIQSASDDFHVYAMEWSSASMKFSVDGINHYTYRPLNKDWRAWPFDAPQFFILNIAMGGTWGGKWGVDPNFTESTMEIDYIRVYQ